MKKVRQSLTEKTANSREKRPDSREKRPDSREKRPDSREKRLDSREKRPDSREKRLDSREKRLDSREKRLDSREKATKTCVWKLRNDYPLLGYRGQKDDSDNFRKRSTMEISKDPARGLNPTCL